jgi:nucleoid DNA-binding protein
VKIALIIRDLLLHNEQLVIPGFGTFRIIHKPARISKTTQVLLPPSKEIVFDSQQKQGDNLLFLSIKKKLGLSESESGEELKKFLHQIEEDIRSGDSAVLEGLGKLIRDKTGNLKFEPLDDLLNLTGVFALPQLEIKLPGKTESVKPSPAPVEKPSIPLTRKKRWWIPAAIVLLLTVIASVIYYTGILSSHSVVSQAKDSLVSASQNPNRIVFGSRDMAKEDSMKDAVRRQLEERTARENALRLNEPARKKELNSARRDAEPVSMAPSKAHGPYHIISGSFTLPGNAEKQQLQLRKKGLTPELLPKRGKYIMVSLGSYASRKEAVAVMEQLRESLEQDLWIMKIQ